MTPEPSENQPETAPAESKPVIPWPGSKYAIRCVKTKKVINFWGGKISMAPMEGRNPLGWEYIEKHGWAQFRDPASHLSLAIRKADRGEVKDGRALSEGDNFIVKHHPTGNYVICRCKRDNFDSVGFVSLGTEVRKDGREVITEVSDSKAALWEFIKVE